MTTQFSSRRVFLSRSLAGLGSTWVVAQWPAILAAHEHARAVVEGKVPAKFSFFDPDQAAEVEAMTEQILPTDGTPGAREAGVIYFIDRALTSFDGDKQALYGAGLQQLRTKTVELYPHTHRFSQLSSAQQIEVLKTIERTDFFETVRIHTVVGFFASPEYGGNRDKVSWKLIGFEDNYAFEPPFGFYDRDYNEETR